MKNEPDKFDKNRIQRKATMIGMTSKEIEISIKPLRRVFVKSLVTFLGR